MKICKDCINLIKKVRRNKKTNVTGTGFKCLVDGEKLNLLDTEVIECNKYESNKKYELLKDKMSKIKEYLK